MSFHDAAVPAYLQMLNSLTGLLTKAEAHCAAKKVDPSVLLGSRLFPDMLPLSKQIQLVSDFASKGCARLTHSEVPSTADTETSFAELKQRLAKTIDYVKSFKPEQFEGADTKDVTFPAGPDKSITMKGQQFLSAFSLPNFYFHAATAHGLLRHARRRDRQARFPRRELSYGPRQRNSAVAAETAYELCYAGLAA
ncbi:hypothetical protein ACVWWP_006905 [Bradyrhizobium sp. LM3.6]